MFSNINNRDWFENFPHNGLSRRDLLRQMSCGFGSLALSAMVQRDAACSNQLAPQLVHHTPRAKRVIFLFMAGGVSQIDSYDYKEKLFKDDGKMIRFDDARTLAKTRQIVKHRVMKPLWNFRQHGDCLLYTSPSPRDRG